MNFIKKTSLFFCILASLNLGFEGLFHINLLQRFLVHFPILFQSIKIVSFFSATIVIRMMFEHQ